MASWTPPRTLRSKATAAAAVCALAGACLAPFEGRVLHTYPDAVYGWKLPTACDGHTGPELRAGQVFTPAECDEMRQADLTKTYDALAPCFGNARLSDQELGAYLSLAYNNGAGAVCHSSIPAKVKAGQRAAACAVIGEFINAGWIRPPKTDGPTDPGLRRDCRIKANGCAGIPRRRAAESALCISGL